MIRRTPHEFPRRRPGLAETSGESSDPTGEGLTESDPVKGKHLGGHEKMTWLLVGSNLIAIVW